MTEWLDLPWWERKLFVFRLWWLQTFTCEHKWLTANLEIMGGEYEHCPQCGKIRQ